MKKIIFWTTIISGATAAYLLFKRGVPATQIASDVISHPIGTLVNELKHGTPTSA